MQHSNQGARRYHNDRQLDLDISTVNSDSIHFSQYIHFAHAAHTTSHSVCPQTGEGLQGSPRPTNIGNQGDQMNTEGLRPVVTRYMAEFQEALAMQKEQLNKSGGDVKFKLLETLELYSRDCAG